METPTASVTTESAESSPWRQLNGMGIRDHTFHLPLDYADPHGETIAVFAREVVDAGKTDQESLPWVVFFQGGPGYPAPRPKDKSGWLGELLKTHRVLLLDQRGTGQSSRVLAQTLPRRGDAHAQAAYLTHFRADNIVRDAEEMRKSLCGADVKWLGLGQSYGGFCLLTYLSFAPEGLAGVMITGGVACVKRRIEDNYRLTYAKVREKTEAFYRRYPEDEALARKVLRHLIGKAVTLPGGGILSPRRFQQLGMLFGMSGGFETLHYLLEGAFVDGVDGPELAYDFLRQFENLVGFETNPIFTILHESIYPGGYATNWAAERLRDEFPEVALDPEKRVWFTGEMVSPCMLEDYAELRPLKECAEILARKDDWCDLYDLDQLSRNEVPVSAISYYGDMYVPIEWSRETALHMPRFAQWITNEWEHNGLGVDGERIMKRLMAMLRDA